MNDRRNPPAIGRPDLALKPGTYLGVFEFQRVVARSISTTVYLATDHALTMPVAIQEYLPVRFAVRGDDQRLRLSDPWHEDLAERGHRAFVEETRMLARCDHPALVRMLQLFEANGTVYRVMPFYDGGRLLDVRHAAGAAPSEAALRSLLDGLLGALDAIHRSGQIHGGVTPANILVLADDRPLLLAPGAAQREIDDDLVGSLMATLAPTREAASGGAAAPADAAADLRALAEVAHFCITGAWADGAPNDDPRKPLAQALAERPDTGAHPPYSAALLSALDAAASPHAEDRPLHAAQFREWLQRGAPRSAAPPGSAAPAQVPPEVPVAVAAAVPPPEPAPEPSEPEAAPQPEEVRTPAAATMEDGESVAPHPAFAFSEPPLGWGPRAEPPMLDLDEEIATARADRAPWVSTDLTAKLAQRAETDKRKRLALLGGAVALVAAAGIAIAVGAWEPFPPALPLAAPAGADGNGETASSEPTLPQPGAMRADTPPPNSPTPTPLSDTPGPRAACGERTGIALYRCMQVQCQATRWLTHPQCLRLTQDTGLR